MRPRPWVMFGFAACLACQAASSTPPMECARGSCVADPAPHCVLDGCVDTGDCPTGLVCEGGSELTGPGACVWNPAPVRRRALRDGFMDAGSMPANFDPISLAIEWEAPEGTRYVVCALFGSEPVFRAKSSVPRSPVEIYNFRSCALEVYVSKARNGAALLDQPDLDLLSDEPLHYGDILVPFDSQCSSEDPALAALDRVVETLSWGCWAYDDYHVSAASDLNAILVDSLPGRLVMELRNSDCKSAGDERSSSCYDREHDFFGACAGGICEPRCALDHEQDCATAATRYFGAVLEPPAAWTCEVVANSMVGVCVPKQ